jgi:antitoxin component of MazEF toxin-antitoxin module
VKQCYASRYWKMGGSYGVILPPDVRKQLQLHPGDLVLMRLYGPLLILRRVTADMVVERDTIPTEALPPAAVGG